MEFSFNFFNNKMSKR